MERLGTVPSNMKYIAIPKMPNDCESESAEEMDGDELMVSMRL